MNTNAFKLRHIGPRENDQLQMLKAIGVEDMDQLLYETIPDDIRLKQELNLDEPMSEQEYLVHINELAKKNKVIKTKRLNKHKDNYRIGWETRSHSSRKLWNTILFVGNSDS